MSITKADLMRQLEELEKAEADELSSQSLEKPKGGKVIRVVQASKRTKNPKQQERTPAQIEATRKMLEARKKKLADKKEQMSPKEDEVVMVIEPPKKPRKPYTRKTKVDDPPQEEKTQLKPLPPKRAVNKRRVKKEIIYEESESESESEYEEYYETRQAPPTPPQQSLRGRDKRFS
jgi:hypothetical protein